MEAIVLLVSLTLVIYIIKFIYIYITVRIFLYTFSINKNALIITFGIILLHQSLKNKLEEIKEKYHEYK